MRLNEVTRTWPAPIQGLNTDNPAELIPELQSPDLINFYHDEGFLRKALGFSKSSTTALTIGGDTITIGRIYNFIKADGTQAYIAEGVRTGSSPQRYVLKFVSGSWSATYILNGLNATAEINFATFGNYLIICNGVDDNYMSDGTAAGTFRLGISPPTTGLGAPTQAAGNITNATYFYRYTYLNNTTGIESNPITSGLSVLYADGSGFSKGTFTAPTNTSAANEGAGHWKLYRTVAGGLTSGPYFLIATGTIAASIEDNLNDTAIGVQIEIDHDVAPKCQVPHVWRSRLWATKETANPSTAYWSRVDKLAYFPRGIGDPLGVINFENVDLNDGDRMTGIGDIGNLLCFYKERSCHPYIHSGGDAFQKLGTIRTFGASNHRTIIQRQGGIWSADFNGVWYFDGQAGIRTTMRIDTTFSGMSDAGKVKFHSAWYEPLNAYILFYQRSGSTSTDAAIMVDTFGLRPRADRVGLFKLEPLKCYGSGMLTDSNAKPIIWIGGTAGHSYEMFKTGVFTYDTAAYSAYFDTKNHQLDPHAIYRMREFIGTFRSTTVGDVTLGWNFDFGNDARGTSFSVTQSGQTVAWTYASAAASWTFGGNPASWIIASSTISDIEAEIEGEGKSIQFTLSNGISAQDMAISKYGFRAQRKRRVA